MLGFALDEGPWNPDDVQCRQGSPDAATSPLCSVLTLPDLAPALNAAPSLVRALARGALALLALCGLVLFVVSKLQRALAALPPHAWAYAPELLPLGLPPPTIVVWPLTAAITAAMGLWCSGGCDRVWTCPAPSARLAPALVADVAPAQPAPPCAHCALWRARDACVAPLLHGCLQLVRPSLRGEATSATTVRLGLGRGTRAPSPELTPRSLLVASVPRAAECKSASGQSR